MAQGRHQTQGPLGALTIAAVATAPGAGAIAVLRASGPGVCALARRALDPDSELPPGRPSLRWMRDERGPIDQVLATVFKAPRSYTGEDVLEISCHGSPYILKRALALLYKEGARPARPGEFTQRAYLNGRLDLSQAEAVGALISARGARAHGAALAQLSGGLSGKVDALRARVLELSAVVEAGLDHPDDAIPALASAQTAPALSHLASDLRDLARAFERGGRISRGYRVVIVGPPNAGKSSLLNALLGRERAIVSETPGTTRDTVEEEIELDDLSCVLIDTAGLRRAAQDPIEERGMERARRALEGADAALLVFDASAGPGPEDLELLGETAAAAERGGFPLLLALNKCDLTPSPTLLPIVERAKVTSAVCSVSALTGEGLADLKKFLAAALDEGGEEAPLWVTGLRHAQALREAAAELESAAESSRGAACLDERAALHLREASESLSGITGKRPDELLDAIFSKFCVGK